MNLLLIGYGKMGKAIEEIAITRGHTIVGKINSSTPLSSMLGQKIDCAIEFTRPELAAENIKFCAEHQIPVAVGTTGWYENYEELKKYVLDNNGTLLAATNFSMGVNITFHINKILASVMSKFPEYQAEITEIHHTQKLDAPSGTAITIAEGIVENHSEYNDFGLAANNNNASTLPIIALREGTVPGTHIVKYSSAIDTITLTHEAHNRTGFALGSILAAEWLLDKKGVFTMTDMLGF